MKDMKSGNDYDIPAMTTNAKPKDTQAPKNVASPRPSRGKTWALTAGVVVLSVLGGFVGSLAAINGSNSLSISPIAQHDTKNREKDGNDIITQSEQNIISVVDRVSPSVVSIISAQSGQAQGAGTGIIISKDGYILTNNHVIKDAQAVQVIASDGTIYKNVKIIGADPLNDMAFLKVSDPKNFQAASIGNSDTLRIGQQVIAIGNALGQYRNTVSSGILSGTGRPISATDGDTVENLTDLLQTDAAINPGNSGGPLLNLAGQVVGINTAIAQDAEGIGFAIPIDAAKGEIASVLAGKGVRRSYLGVKYISITPEVAATYSLPVKQGAYVYARDGSAVVSDGPAAKAGVKEKDIITAINGTKLGTAGGLSTLIGRYQPGEKVQLSVLRDGKTLTLNATLGTYALKTDSSDQKTIPDTNGLDGHSFFDQLFGE